MSDLQNPSKPSIQIPKETQGALQEQNSKEYIYLVEVNSGYHEMNRVWIEDCFKTEAKALAFIDEYKKIHFEIAEKCPLDPDKLFDYDNEETEEEYAKAEREYFSYWRDHLHSIEINSVTIKKMLVK